MVFNSVLSVMYVYMCLGYNSIHIYLKVSPIESRGTYFHTSMHRILLLLVCGLCEWGLLLPPSECVTKFFRTSPSCLEIMKKLFPGIRSPYPQFFKGWQSCNTRFHLETSPGPQLTNLRVVVFLQYLTWKPSSLLGDHWTFQWNWYHA